MIPWIAISVLSALVCGWWAARRSYSGGLYLGMALLLGPGALALTWAATRDPLALPEDSPQVRDWRRRYHDLRQSLCLTLVCIVGGGATAIYLLNQSVLPSVAALFNDMSLALPGPSDALVKCWKLTSGNGASLVALVLALALPGLCYLWATHFAFRVLWEMADQIWMELGAHELPHDVRVRGLEFEARCHGRALLNRLDTVILRAFTALWSVAALMVGGMVFLLLSLFLPLTQLVGCIGG